MGDFWYVSFVGFSSCYGTYDAVGLTQWLYSWKHGGKSACLGSLFGMMMVMLMMLLLSTLISFYSFLSGFIEVKQPNFHTKFLAPEALRGSDGCSGCVFVWPAKKVTLKTCSNYFDYDVLSYIFCRQWLHSFEISIWIRRSHRSICLY